LCFHAADLLIEEIPEFQFSRRVSVSASTTYTSYAYPNGRPIGWSTHELALFSRAARLLASGGLRIETDYGLTDEGEPWLVFCNAESGDVFGHFARVHEGYVACVPFRGHGLRGWELPDLLSRFLRRQGIIPVAITRPVIRSFNRLAAFGLAILQLA
jgi:hypothetical protein